MGTGSKGRQHIDGGWIRGLWAAGLAAAVCPWALGAPIYSCVDGSGKRLTSDRPIAECAAKEQRILNPDGSVRGILPPTMTAEERADAEQKERQAASERIAQQDAIRRDRNLMIRFPNEAAHNKARNAALDDMRTAVQLSEKRLEALALERKPLTDEAEFYKGRQMPAKLKQQLDANDAAGAAQRELIQNQQQELGRINALYDAELGRLKKLWSGAPAGSMGVLPVAQSGSAAASHATKGKTR
jgi:hypothetical protein